MKALPQRQLRRAAGQLQLESAAADPDARLRAHPRCRPAAAASDRGRAGRRRRPDSADHRHQQPRGVDVRLGQAADAADHAGRASTAYFARRGRRTHGTGCWPRTRTIRAAARWSRSAPTSMFVRPGLGVRRRLQRARADLRVPLRPHHLDAAGAGARRHPRQRDRAHPAQLRVLPGPQDPPAGAAGAAGGGPAHAAHLAGLRHPRMGAGAGVVARTGRATTPSSDARGSSGPPATCRSTTPTRSAAAPGRDVLAASDTLVGVAAQVVQEPLEQPPMTGLPSVMPTARRHRWFIAITQVRSAAGRGNHAVVLGERGDAAGRASLNGRPCG